jgi:hypothetical protein
MEVKVSSPLGEAVNCWRLALSEADDLAVGRGDDDLSTSVLGAFGMAAIALTTIGLYGLLAYLVALRGHETGVRLAI